MMKKLIAPVLMGITIGITVGYLLALFFSLRAGATRFYPSSPAFTQQFNTPLTATLAATGLWALMGLGFSLTSLVFQTRWSITRQTVTHLLITYVVFTPLALLAGWFPITGWFLLMYTGEFLAIYAIIWAVGMFIAKRQVRELNQSLAHRKSA